MHSKVEKFAQTMQKEIDDNSHKGDWETFLHKENIMSEFYHHLNKLETVFKVIDLIEEPPVCG